MAKRGSHRRGRSGGRARARLATSREAKFPKIRTAGEKSLRFLSRGKERKARGESSFPKASAPLSAQRRDEEGSSHCLAESAGRASEERRPCAEERSSSRKEEERKNKEPPRLLRKRPRSPPCEPPPPLLAPLRFGGPGKLLLAFLPPKLQTGPPTRRGRRKTSLLGETRGAGGRADAVLCAALRERSLLPRPRIPRRSPRSWEGGGEKEGPRG